MGEGERGENWEKSSQECGETIRGGIKGVEGVDRSVCSLGSEDIVSQGSNKTFLYS